MALVLLFLLLLRASYPMLFVTNKTQLVGSGQSPCSQLNSAIDGTFGRKYTVNIHHKQLDFVLFPHVTGRNFSCAECVPRRLFVHSERPWYSSSIPLPFCRTKQRRRKAQQEEISLRVPYETPSCCRRMLCKLARPGLETIKDISKTIAGSDRA